MPKVRVYAAEYPGMPGYYPAVMADPQYYRIVANSFRKRAEEAETAEQRKELLERAADIEKQVDEELFRNLKEIEYEFKPYSYKDWVDARRMAERENGFDEAAYQAEIVKRCYGLTDADVAKKSPAEIRTLSTLAYALSEPRTDQMAFLSELLVP